MPAAKVTPASRVKAAGGKRLLLRSFVAPSMEGKKWYPTEDVRKPAKRTSFKKGVTAKLRASIKPGTVLILLAGRFQGKRVVFLKQLKSGLLLVNGPFSVNKVPLKRVSQAYVIATSKVLAVNAASFASVTDDLFSRKDTKLARRNASGTLNDAEAFFAVKAKKTETDESRKTLQKAVDAAITLDATTTKYLKTKFALSSNQRPHAMKF